ncbi:hypothetical protein [Ruegeria sp. Alg231-54]|uniref:hypothetical protein n=1 Tax=Ruegeria sp. Alg231-54 TaxID=1922221 RepID=UPI000D55968E|nr:hypothetical protein [Ruegeria sp. Alg231-54]
MGAFIETAFTALSWKDPIWASLDWLVADKFDEVLADLKSQRTQEQRTGITTGWICGDQLDDETQWTGFLIRVSSVCKSGGFGKRTKNAIMATFSEFRSNILEHAGETKGAIAAFHLGEKGLEIVVADQGRGALASMRNSKKFRNLDDAGRALKLIVTDGVSRYDNPERGHGFTHLFQGLANRFNHIRLRSGDHALEVFRPHGETPLERISQKAEISGLLVYAFFNTDL